MSKLKTETSVSFLNNVMFLMFSQVVVKLLGLVYRVAIVDAEGFGNTGNGYYATGYQVYMVLLAISCMGIGNVVSKLVSERAANGDYRGAHRVFKLMLTMFASFGFFLTLVLFFGADFISTTLLKASGVKYTLMVLAPALTIVSVSAVVRGYFSGLGSMKALGSSQMIEQVFNCILSIAFVYMCVGYDSSIMAAAGNVSTTMACGIALVYLIFYYRKRRPDIKEQCRNQEVEQEKISRRKLVKIIIALAFPIAISSLISVVNSIIDIFTVSHGIQRAFASVISSATELEEKAMELYGIMQKAEVIIHLPLAISGTLCAAIVPVISSALAKKNMGEVNSKISSATFVSGVLMFPCMGGIMALAAPILKLLYPSAPEGDLMLILLSTTLSIASLTYVLNGILYGMGKQHIPAITLAAGSAIKLILNLTLIPLLNIYGAIIGTLVYQTFVFVVECVVVYRSIEIKLDYVKNFVKPILSALIMSVLVLLSYKLCSLFAGNAISTVVSICVGVVVYAVVMLLLKTFSEDDFKSIPKGDKILLVLRKIKLIKG